MSLTPGTRLGPYEVTAQIGAGGMGEVYRARDPRLGRDVAIKVLPEAFAADTDRLTRFEQEARAAAALNHPNILAVHDIGRHDGSPYIVSELLDGETLREPLIRGALPVRKAVEYGVQIAHGLAAAHEKGITHRDLKPENVFITSDERVKILDFGLAKLTNAEPAGVALSALPTTPPNTLPGVVLGTIGCMAPEQVRGLTADYRSGIFAFGAILYEMLSGQRAFRGDTPADTMSAILSNDPPDLPVADRHIPPALARCVARCLEKSPTGRFQSTRDLAFALEALTSPSAPSAGVAAVSSGPGRTPRERLAWILAAGVLLLVAAVSLPFAVIHVREAGPDSRSIRFDVPMPEKVNAEGAPPAISPDGRRLAFVASLEGRTQVWIRPIDSTAAQPLAGTDGADYPFWSPDSRSIAFFAGGKLRKIEASGGPPQTLSDAPIARGGAWNQDGVIVFAPTATGPLHRVAAAGGTSTPVTALDASNGEISHRSPSFLPDGRRFLFHVQGAEDKQGIYMGSLDVEALALTGDAFPIAEQVGAFYTFSSTFSVSDDGVLALSGGVGGFGSDRQLVWYDRAGRIVERVGTPIPIADVVLSPEERRAAVQWSANDIRVVDLVRGGVPSRLTFNASVEDFPVWSPDGNRILYTSTAGGGQNMYSKLSSGAGSEDDVLRSATVESPTDWSHDGRFILYENSAPGSQADIWVLPLFGDRKPLLFLQTPFAEQHGRFSPDGKWIAYVSNETGRTEVYVQSFPPSGGKWQLSTNGGVTPRWRRDGRELFYLAPDRKIMAVEVKAGGSTFDHGSAKALFEASVDAISTGATNRYDVSADGQRFLVNASIENRGSAPITVVVNWLAGVKTGR